MASDAALHLSGMFTKALIFLISSHARTSLSHSLHTNLTDLFPWKSLLIPSADYLYSPFDSLNLFLISTLSDLEMRSLNHANRRALEQISKLTNTGAILTLDLKNLIAMKDVEIDRAIYVYAFVFNYMISSGLLIMESTNAFSLDLSHLSDFGTIVKNSIHSLPQDKEKSKHYFLLTDYINYNTPQLPRPFFFPLKYSNLCDENRNMLNCRLEIFGMVFETSLGFDDLISSKEYCSRLAYNYLLTYTQNAAVASLPKIPNVDPIHFKKDNVLSVEKIPAKFISAENGSTFIKSFSTWCQKHGIRPNYIFTETGAGFQCILRFSVSGSLKEFIATSHHKTKALAKEVVCKVCFI